MRYGPLISASEAKKRGIERTGDSIKVKGIHVTIYRDDGKVAYALHSDGFHQMIPEESNEYKDAKGTTHIDMTKPAGDKKPALEVLERKERKIGTVSRIVPEKREINITPGEGHMQVIINQASDVAKVLVDVIEKCKLYVVINKKKYVRVEGWETLGAGMNYRCEITSLVRFEKGWRARAEIKDIGGNVVSTGEAICTRDEKNWATRDDFAIMSMAQTRALGKAYRLGCAWIMALAGYETCPAEEMK